MYYAASGVITLCRWQSGAQVASCWLSAVTALTIHGNKKVKLLHFVSKVQNIFSLNGCLGRIFQGITPYFLNIHSMPDCWLEVSNRKVLRPATSTQVYSRFPCVYKQTLRRFPTFQVATTCFSCSPPDSVVTDFMFCLHVK